MMSFLNFQRFQIVHCHTRLLIFFLNAFSQYHITLKSDLLRQKNRGDHYLTKVKQHSKQAKSMGTRVGGVRRIQEPLNELSTRPFHPFTNSSFQQIIPCWKLSRTAFHEKVDTLVGSTFHQSFLHGKTISSSSQSKGAIRPYMTHFLKFSFADPDHRHKSGLSSCNLYLQMQLHISRNSSISEKVKNLSGPRTHDIPSPDTQSLIYSYIRRIRMRVRPGRAVACPIFWGKNYH